MLMMGIEYSFDPDGFDGLWENFDADGQKKVIFDKTLFETKAEAQEEYNELIKDYEEQENWMVDACKYIYYKGYLYPAKYKIENRRFVGDGLISNMEFKKNEVDYWTDEEPDFPD